MRKDWDNLRPMLQEAMDGSVERGEECGCQLAIYDGGKVSSLVTSLQKFGNTLEEASPKLNEILDNFDQISDTIAKADIAGVISNANSTIKEVQTLVAKANNGDGTVSALLNDEGLVKKIDDTIKSLNDLLKDFQDNPRHYLKPLGEKKKKSKK